MKNEYKKAKEQARQLYFGSELKQSEIAEKVGVSPKSICLWISEGKWNEIRLGICQSPRYIVAQLNQELIAMNESIRSRPPGQQFPTKEEAALRKTIVQTANLVHLRESFGSDIEVMLKFFSFLSEDDRNLAKRLILKADAYLRESWSDIFEKHPNIKPAFTGDSFTDTHPF